MRNNSIPCLCKSYCKCLLPAHTFFFKNKNGLGEKAHVHIKVKQLYSELDLSKGHRRTYYFRLTE